MKLRPGEGAGWRRRDPWPTLGPQHMTRHTREDHGTDTWAGKRLVLSTLRSQPPTAPSQPLTPRNPADTKPHSPWGTAPPQAAEGGPARPAMPCLAASQYRAPSQPKGPSLPESPRGRESDRQGAGKRRHSGGPRQAAQAARLLTRMEGSGFRPSFRPGSIRRYPQGDQREKGHTEKPQ